jgi:transposase
VWVPDAAHEALRDLVRTREAAKKDQLRARHRLSKLLLRRGLRPPMASKAWGSSYMTWVKALRFEERALEAAFLDLLYEVEHGAERIVRLERSIDDAVARAPESMRAVIGALQALRGVSKMSAATLVAEIGEFSRFAKARQIMGYSGMVSSE